MTAGCSTGPTPVPRPSRIGIGGTGGQLARARGVCRSARIREDVPSGTSPPVRVARPSGVPVCHADGGAGPGESEEREVVLAGTTSKTDSLGAPARETACRRGKREGSAPRDARTLRRHDPSPPGGGAADPRRGRWGLAAAPWERRRITAGTGVANGRVEHPTRAAPAGGQVSAADAPPGDRAHPTRSHRASRHGARRSNGARRPSHGRGPQGTLRGEGASIPRWFTYVSSFAGLSNLGTTPGTSFAGVHGSEGGPSIAPSLEHPARRAPDGGIALDEVSR